MSNAADLEARYASLMDAMTDQQRWAVEVYGTARALVAVERGSMLAGGPDDLRVAREVLFAAQVRRPASING